MDSASYRHNAISHSILGFCIRLAMAIPSNEGCGDPYLLTQLSCNASAQAARLAVRTVRPLGEISNSKGSTPGLRAKV